MSRPQTERLGASLRLGLRPALRACKIVPDNFVVRRVEQLFAFADQLEAKVAAAKTRIDHLTQSILAKAFARPVHGTRPAAHPTGVQNRSRRFCRGELVPQDPNDEPASVLLERLKAQRAAAPKAKRGRKASA